MKASVFVVMAALLTLGSLEVKAEHEGHSNAAASDPQTSSPARSGRLRFRDGPVCMCSLGMTEEDIRKAQMERMSRR